MKNFLLKIVCALSLICFSQSSIAVSATPANKVVKVTHTFYEGSFGFFITNCQGTVACIGDAKTANNVHYFVKVDHPLHKSYLSTSLLSLSSGSKVILRGSGVCHPANCSGYELLGSMDILDNQ
jgi:hypothetical protein